jgi:hypothetical protein
MFNQTLTSRGYSSFFSYSQHITPPYMCRVWIMMFVFCFSFASSSDWAWGQQVAFDMLPNSINYSTYDSTSHEPAYIFDQFGTIYNVGDVMQKRGGADEVICSGANFDVTFFYEDDPGEGFNHPTLGQIRRDILCQVVNDVSQLIDTPSDVCDPTSSKPNLRIRIESVVNPDNAALAYATALHYNYAQNLEGVVYNSVWRYLNGGTDPLDYPFYNAGGMEATLVHGIITCNFAYPYYYGTTGTPSTGEYDFYTATLHEFMHLLGIYSMIKPDGTSNLWGNNVYTKYDSFLSTQNTASFLLDNNDGCYDVSFNNANLLTLAIPGCDNLIFNGATGTPADVLDVPVVFPASGFVIGSSLSHFSSNCSPYTLPHFLMHPGLSTATTIRSPKPEEVSVLCHLGYQTTGTYGSGATAVTYTPCGSILAAVDDPCEGYYTIDACEGNLLEIPISEIRGNDHGVVGVDCVEVEKGNGSVTATSTNIIFNPNNDAGFHIISYMGVDADGNKSNPAFIYIIAATCDCYNCDAQQAEPCNLICNSAMFDANCATNMGQGANQSIFDTCPTFAGWDEIVSTCDYNPGMGLISPGILQISCHNLFDDYNASEVLVTCAPISQNQRYILSVVDRVDEASDGSILMDEINLCLGNSQNLTAWPFGYDINLLPFTPTDQIVLTDNNFANGNWHQVVSCFTADQNYDALYFWAEHDLEGGTFAYFDHVELIEDEFPIANQILSTPCGLTATIGDPTCISSQQELIRFSYTWAYSVDNGVNWIPMPNIDATISVSPLITTQYKLIRTFDAGTATHQIINAECVTQQTIYTIEILDPNCCTSATPDTYLYFNSDNQVVPYGTAGATPNYTAPAQTATVTPTSSNNPFGTGVGTVANPVRINGDIIIPANADISFMGMHFEFGPNGRIVLKRSTNIANTAARLHFNNACTLTGDPTCQTMWQGIRVEGPGQTTAAQVHNMARLWLDKTVVEDAIIGVATTRTTLFDMATVANSLTTDAPDVTTNNLVNPSAIDLLPNTADAGFNGGWIEVFGSTFNNCYYGIYFAPYSGAGTTYFPLGATYNINATSFVSTTLHYPFTPNFRGEGGIVSKDLKRTIDVRGSYFNNLTYGIRANHADNRLRYRVGANVFDNCTRGISMRNLITTDGQVDITNNTLTNCNIAIQTDGVFNCNINSLNHITGTYTTGTPAAGTYDVGILMRGGDFEIGSQILNGNTINNVAVGILIADSDVSGNIIQNNAINNTYAAIYVVRNNASIQIKCNDLNNYHQFGIGLDKWITNGTMPNQGHCLPVDPAPEPASNTFTPAVGAPWALWRDVANTSIYTYYDINATTLPSNGVTTADCTEIAANCGIIGGRLASEVIGMEDGATKDLETSKLLRQYIADSNEVAARQFLEDLDTRLAKRGLVNNYYTTDETTTADTKLESILRQTNEDDNFYTLYKMLINLKQDGRTLTDITDDEESTLLQIADSKSNTAYRAQALLYAARGTEFDVLLPELPNAAGSGGHTVFKTNHTLSHNICTLQPNPAANEVSVIHNLQDKQQGILRLYDLNGRLLYQQTLLGKGSHTFSIEKYSAGIYFYSITVDNTPMQREKLIIIR